MASKESNPSLTTIHQEANLRAKTAIECLEAMRDGTEYKPQIVLPVDLRQYRIILSADTASEVRQMLAKSADNTLCIIEHFGNADAVPQPPERCLSRQAGIVRYCLKICARQRTPKTPNSYFLTPN